MMSSNKDRAKRILILVIAAIVIFAVFKLIIEPWKTNQLKEKEKVKKTSYLKVEENFLFESRSN